MTLTLGLVTKETQVVSDCYYGNQHPNKVLMSSWVNMYLWGNRGCIKRLYLQQKLKLNGPKTTFVL